MINKKSNSYIKSSCGSSPCVNAGVSATKKCFDEASNRYTYPFLFEFKLNNDTYLRYIASLALNKIVRANDMTNLLYFEAIRSFRSTIDNNDTSIHITIPFIKYTSFDDFKKSNLLTIMKYYSYDGYMMDYDKIVDI